MATLTESTVAVSVQLVTAVDGSKHAYVTGSSFDANGVHLRDMGETEVTQALTPTQQQAALTLLNAAEAWLKSQWDIA